MAKSAKQNNRKNKSKQVGGQRRQSAARGPEPAPAAADASATAAAEPATTAPEESQLATKVAVAQELRAALLAKEQQHQQKQWKQQLKAGKMVGAHVPKRFNRGG